MSNDLISREKVVSIITDFFMQELEELPKWKPCKIAAKKLTKKHSQLIDKICDINSSYDVDKVIEQLEEESYEANDSLEYADQMQLDLSDAIDIVRSGGVE